MSQTYSISEAAKQVGLSVPCVRNYMQFRLFSCRKSAGSGRYLLDDACIHRLQLIASAMQAGISMYAVRSFLDSLDTRDSGELSKQYSALISDLNDRQHVIKKILRELQNAVANPDTYITVQSGNQSPVKIQDEVSI